MRPLALVFLAGAAATAGCGSSDDRGERTRAAETATTVAQAESTLRPPEIHVVTAAGRQRATPGKSCVLTVGQGRGEGAAECTIPKRRVRARVFSVARPGGRIEIQLDDATIIRRPGCTDRRECGGRASVRRAGCAREIASFPLRRARTRWTVSLPPGAYELELSVDFETPDARTGDATAVAGLIVDPRRPLDILTGVRSDPSCAQG